MLYFVSSMKKTAVVVVTLILVAGAALPAAASVPSWSELGEEVGSPPPVLTPGDASAWVTDLQKALNQAGFSAGASDGRFGRQTLAAVYALEKHYGLERDGRIELSDWALLEAEVELPGWAPEPDRVEIDLNKQVLYLIQGGELSGVFPVSSANGGSFRNYTGRLVRARTPEGRFAFQRRREGWWKSYLGFLYRPFYFRGGYAIHGSGSVPPFPASHGCVRVEVADMDFLATQFELGMTVYVYGVSTARSDVVPAPPDEPVVEVVEPHLSVG
jgi:peptidoglycan hydrolase-like protein with peptidoglycan-binding domain